LQGVQWTVRLVVVRASWPGHPHKSKKNKRKKKHNVLGLFLLFSFPMVTRIERRGTISDS
jgi:uncharacterized membrane protein